MATQLIPFIPVGASADGKARKSPPCLKLGDVKTLSIRSVDGALDPGQRSRTAA
jgi:hypothetical protein